MIFGRVDLLDQSGELAQTWLVDSQCCQIGADSNLRICIESLAPIHATLNFGRRNTLVKCLQGTMTIGTKSLRESLIDEPTTIDFGVASLVVYPTTYVRHAVEQSVSQVEEAQPLAEPELRSVAAIETDAEPSQQPPGVPTVSAEALQEVLVSSTVNAVQRSLEPFQSTLCSLAGKWDELLNKVKAPSPAITDEIERRFEHIERQIPQLSSELGEMNGRLARSLDSTNDSMSSMASEIRERFDFISQRFDQKDDSREACIDNTLSLLSEQLRQIQEQLTLVSAISTNEGNSFAEPVRENLEVVEPLEYVRTAEPLEHDSSYDDRQYEDRSNEAAYTQQTESEADSSVSYSIGSHSENVEYQSEYDGYSEEVLDENYSNEAGDDVYPADIDAAGYAEQVDVESTSDIVVDQNYPAEYDLQEERYSEPEDYAYELRAEVNEELDASSYAEEQFDYPSSDTDGSDLLSQAQQSEYDPEPYYHDSVVQRIDETPELENQLGALEDEILVEDRTHTASYTPVSRLLQDSEQGVDGDSAEEYPDQYSVDAMSDALHPSSIKAALPEWFTQDAEVTEIDSVEDDEVSDLENKLDSAVYHPIRSHESAALDEANLSRDLVIEEDSIASLAERYTQDQNVEPDIGESPSFDESLLDVEIDIEDETSLGKSSVAGLGDTELGSNEELADDEESVEQYMQRLLARVKGGDTVGHNPAPLKTHVKPTSIQARKSAENSPVIKVPVDSQEFASHTLSDEEYTPRSAAPEHSMNLEAMRSLANETARTAIAKSSNNPEPKHSNFSKLGISAFGFIIGTLLLLVNGITINVAFLGMICGYLIFLIWGFEATQGAGLTTKRT